MDNIKNDAYYLKKIKADMCFIDIHMREISRAQFEADELLQDSMMFRLIQISENAKKISEGYRRSNKSIPWNDIYGLRNRIVHEYGNVDLTIVYDTLLEDIPEVMRLLK